MNGWMGKILSVDLSNSRITQLSTQPYAEKYLGGRGIATKIYVETVSFEIKAFDPDNRLIFMSGPLVAVGVQGATRMVVIGKSPCTDPEGFCYGNIGGFFSAELKKAGFDGIVFSGCSPKPVYLWIHDGEAELKDASALWGKGASHTGELLKQTHGEKVRFVSTGVAGENRVRTAIVFASHNSACIGGFGAVMGSKNLKAIAVLGSGKPSVAQPEKLKELNRYTINLSKRMFSTMAIPPNLEKGGYTKSIKVIGKGSCYQCALECIRNVYRYDHRLEANRKCQAMAYYAPSVYSQEDEPIDTVFDAPTLANDYSIDTMELQNMIDWLYACYKAGITSEAETGLPLSKIGTREFLEKLLYLISYRQGFGDTLAEGLWRTSKKASKDAQALLSPTFVPVGFCDTLSPRTAIVQSLIYQMEPRGDQALFHEIGQVFPAWRLNQQHPDQSPVTTKVIHDIAKAFWGSDEAGDFTSYEGKALAAKITQNRLCSKDSLGLCDYTWPMMYSFNTPDPIGDPDLEAKTFTAVTGIPTTKGDLDRFGERIFNLQRLIMLREGRKVPEADFPLEQNFNEPLEASIHGNMVPGPGETTVDVTGNCLDRDKFINLLKEYYRLRGWNEENGRPLPETLAALGLNDVDYPASMPFKNKQE